MLAGGVNPHHGTAAQDTSWRRLTQTREGDRPRSRDSCDVRNARCIEPYGTLPVARVGVTGCDSYTQLQGSARYHLHGPASAYGAQLSERTARSQLNHKNITAGNSQDEARVPGRTIRNITKGCNALLRTWPHWATSSYHAHRIHWGRVSRSEDTADVHRHLNHIGRPVNGIPDAQPECHSRDRSSASVIDSTSHRLLIEKWRRGAALY